MTTSKNIQSNNISVVLVAPEHPNNIGSVARAMNNMGFFDLRLVNPCPYLTGGEDGAKTLAVHSQFILENAKIYSTLKEALIDKQIIIGTTTRPRGHHKELSSCWQLDSFLSNLSDATQIAFVFGRETSGLTNLEIDLCNHLISIPTFGENSSLNLSQAVVILLYETSKTINKSNKNNISSEPLASSNHIEKLKDNLFFILKNIGYIKEGNTNKRLNIFSKLISDKKFTEKEVDIIQGVINKIKKLI